jgi:Protein of unknown function (DUF4038)/Putative collagen-binding domain of a collagenase
MKMKFLWVCVSLCSVSGCSNNESTPRPRMPAVIRAGAKSPGSLPSPIAVTTATSYAYPLKVSQNGRYLVDQSNKPFRIQGDSAQSLIANLTYSEADTYLSNRQAKGFNTVNINLLEHKFAINAPANRSGDVPFIRPGVFSTPNEAYFAFGDSIIDLAASKGMLVSLAAMYLGYGGGDEGWWEALISGANTQAVCYNFGSYIGNRYKNRKNILWVIGGDYMPPAGSEGEARLHKFMEGIKAAGATQLWTGDWKAPSVSTDELAFASSMDVNAVYTSGMGGHTGTTYGAARSAYDYSPPHPAYLKETGYENESLIAGDPASVRKYEYWAILGGSTAGAFFGNRDIWEFATATWWSGFPFGHGPWQDALESTGTFDMVCLGQLLDSVPWYDLVPSGLPGTKTLVIEGGGTYGQLDYVTAAATADGRVLLTYVPPTATNSSITVDMTVLSGSARARWFDPTSGNYIDAGSSFLNAGSRTFTIPGNNSGAARDWVLVLQVIKPGRRAQSPGVLGDPKLRPHKTQHP